jgi:hypothetical protein
MAPLSLNGRRRFLAGPGVHGPQVRPQSSGQCAAEGGVAFLRRGEAEPPFTRTGLLVIPDPQDVNDWAGRGGLLPRMEPIDSTSARDRWFVGWPLGWLRVRRGRGRGARDRSGRIGRRWAGRARRQWVGQWGWLGVGSRAGHRDRVGSRVGVGSRIGHRRAGALSIGPLPVVPPHRTLRSAMVRLPYPTTWAAKRGCLGGRVAQLFERPAQTHPWLYDDPHAYRSSRVNAGRRSVSRSAGGGRLRRSDRKLGRATNRPCRVASRPSHRTSHRSAD